MAVQIEDRSNEIGAYGNLGNAYSTVLGISKKP